MGEPVMTAFLRPLFSGLLMASLAFPSLAQSTDEASEETPELGQAYLKATHGDWTIRCERAPIGQAEPCDMFFVVTEQDMPVIEFGILRTEAPDGVIAGAFIHTPLEVLLTQGIKIAIDGSPAGAVPYVFCTPRLCRSEFPLKESDINAFKRGGKASMEVVVLSEPPRSLNFEVSLTGFTAAFDALPE